MDYNDIGRSIALHVQPYLPMHFTAIDVTCDYTGKVKPPVRCNATVEGKSETYPMWSTDMHKNLKVDFENFQRVSTKRIIRVHFHCEKNGDFYFKYDYEK